MSCISELEFRPFRFVLHLTNVPFRYRDYADFQGLYLWVRRLVHFSLYRYENRDTERFLSFLEAMNVSYVY